MEMEMKKNIMAGLIAGVIMAAGASPAVAAPPERVTIGDRTCRVLFTVTVAEPDFDTVYYRVRCPGNDIGWYTVVSGVLVPSGAPG